MKFISRLAAIAGAAAFLISGLAATPSSAAGPAPKKTAVHGYTRVNKKTGVVTHVKSYTKTTPSGKTIHVKSYTRVNKKTGVVTHVKGYTRTKKM